MVCIYCQSDTRVVNSRHQKRSNGIWRRRQCVSCQTVFTTREDADLSASIVVRKDKAVEPFSRDRLLLSINDSLKHRKTATADATALTDTIIEGILPQVSSATIEVLLIAQISLSVLKRFDSVAATHYQAFHPGLEGGS